jgi:drug/metabolite transporter (DMT)-like permease
VINRRQIWGLVALTLMWGINWPMMKYSLRELSPLYFRALTMSFGALWLFSYYRFKGVRMWPQPAEWRSVIALGLPNMLGWHTLSILGVKELARGRAAILGFPMPIWTVVLGVLLFKEKLTRCIGFAMVAVALTSGLLTFNELSALSGKPLGIVWMELAALCWAAGTLMMRRMHLTIPMETLTVWMLVLASVCLWVFAAMLEPWPSWQFSAPLWGSLVYGALINYGFAQVIWFGLARHLPPATSAMSVMAVPMVGTLSAALIVNEMPGWQDLVAVLCVMLAIAAVLLPPRNPAKTL